MALTEGQFKDLEKRLLSFKAQFGITHTSKELISGEKFGKSYNIYPEDILTDTNNIIVNSDGEGPHADSNIYLNPSRIRTWTKATNITNGGASVNDIREQIIRGNFSTEIQDDPTLNPNVELVILPLTKVKGTNGQIYTAYGEENISEANYNSKYAKVATTQGSYAEAKYDKHALDQSKILTNFINPAKFGGSYAAKIFASNTAAASASVDFYNPNPLIALDAGGLPNNNEGWIFDYKTGILLLGTNGLVETSNDAEPPGNDVINEYQHPLWIYAYRYIGPTGYSHPSASITASNIQVNDTLNIDGGITFAGLSFASVESSNTTGSTVFGNDVTGSIHKFTGSVFITGGLFVDGENTTGGGGGGKSGINPIVFPEFSSLYGLEADKYLNTTIEPTDQHDVIEYTSSFGLNISGSIQSGSVIVKLGSSSYSHISKSLRGTANLADVINSNPLLDSSPIPKNNNTLLDTIFGSGSANGFLFNFNTVDGKDYPELSSYAPFLIPKYGVSTHSFSFPEEIYIGRIGVYYGQNNLNANFAENQLGYDGDEDGVQDNNEGICTIQLSGSKNGTEWFPIFETSSIRDRNDELQDTYYVHPTHDPETPLTNYSPNENEPNIYNLIQGSHISVGNYTSGIITPQNEAGIPQKYKYYKLHVSGGLEYPLDTNYIVHYLHHIQLWENKSQGIGNRKRLTIAFDDNQDPNKVEGFTKFDTKISQSVGKLGITQTPSSEDSFMFTGTAQDNGNFNNFNLTGVGEFEATNVSTNNLRVSNSIEFNNDNTSFTETKLTPTTIRTHELQIHDSLINENYTLNKGPLFMLNDINQAPTSLTSRSIVLDSLNPIYFTNRTQNGDLGVDDFSGRIFGHYTAQGASDLYIDAFRIFAIADQEIRLNTLGSNTTASIDADLIKLDGSVQTNTISSSGAIYASAYYLNDSVFTGGGGSGFPHNQSTTETTASIEGVLEIKTGDTIKNSHIILGEVTEEDIFTQNKTQNNILHNFGNTLYWGDAVISSGDSEANIFENVTLAGNPLDLNSVGIGGTGNIDITGDILATDTGSFGHLLFSASLTPSHSSNLYSLVYDESTNQVYYTGSYGAGGTGGEDDDWTVSLLSNAINTPYVKSDRNVKVTGSIDVSTSYKIDANDVLSTGTGDDKKILKLASPDFSSLQVEFQQPVFTISESGNVGIFNPDPTEKLVVEGNISSSGLLYVKGLSTSPKNNIVTYDRNDGRFYITSSTAFSGDSNTVTDIVEDSTITVDPSGVPYIFSDPNSNSIKVQRDNGTTSTGFPSTPTPDVTSNSSSLIDNVLPPEFFIIYPNNLNGTTQKAANIIFNFKKPVVISEFRQKFGYEENNYYLPTNVKIYGKNSEFLGSDLDEGILLTQGARPSIAGVYDQDEEGNGNLGNSGGEFNHSEPWISYNTKRTSSIPETSLTSSFQYYRIRYSGSFSHTSTKNFSGVFIDKITPISRSFTQGTTISFNNGVINGPQIITNNLIGTASYALYSEISDYATNGFPFSGSAVISGSLNVNGNTNLQNLSLEGDLNLNNYSINNASTLETNNITAANINTSIINTSTTNTDVLNVGNFPISQPNNQGINTTGPINVSSIIPTNFTEPYDGLVSLSLGRAGANIGLLQTPSSGQNTDTRTLTPLNFTFTGDSSHSIIDDNLNTNIIVNQNTLGTTLVFTGDENFSYPNYGLYDGSYSEPFQELIQTSSFYIKLRFPEPVLIEEFRFNFPTTTSDILEYNYLENSMSLDGTRLFTNGTQQTIGFDGSYITDLYGYDSDIDNINDTPASFWGGSNHWFISPKLGVLVDDPTTNFLYVGTNDSPWEPNSILSTFTSNTGLPANHRGVGLGFEGYFQNPYLDDPEIDLNDPEAGLHLGYDFGEGNETIIHKYRLYQYKNNMISDMVFEACNDTSSGDWTLVDVNMDITTYENVINGLYTTIQTFEPQNSLNPITTRDNSNFQNTTPFRFYRFRFLGGDTTFFKIEFFEAETITDGVTSGFNPEYVSIYSNENQGSSGFSNSQHYLGSGLFKGTTTISQTDTKITASLTDFNSNNGYPLSKLYTIEFSGSHNPFNFAGVSEIQPVTRSFTTQSITIGPNIEYPSLPEGHPNGINCSNANAVYYNESAGTFYYTSSCGGDSSGETDTFSNINIGTINALSSGDRVISTPEFIFNKSVTIENDLLIGGKIKGKLGHSLTLGDKHKPIKDIHMDRGTIFFYSGSTEDSSSIEQARLTINSSSKEIEFKSGSEFNKIRASEINLGSSDSFSGQGSVQIGQSTQGFIAVNAEPGKFSTVLRAESTTLTGDQRMGSITQKGSGSFAILLDADTQGIRPDAKFAIYSNTAVPGVGTQLLSVSESFETRVHNGGLRADNYVTTTNITASGTISSNNIEVKTLGSNKNVIRLTPTNGHITLSNNNGTTILQSENTSSAAFGRDYVAGSIIQKGSGSFTLLLDADNTNDNKSKFSIRSNSAVPGVGGIMLTVSESSETRMYGHLKVDSHITASGNISGSHITTASFGSLQLSNLPTSPTGLPTGSVWVSGSQNDTSTSNVNCGTLRIVI